MKFEKLRVLTYLVRWKEFQIDFFLLQVVIKNWWFALELLQYRVSAVETCQCTCEKSKTV